MPAHGEEQSELAEGTRLLDRYVILDLVGGGGMASIYRANDERLNRVVCVKLLRLEVKTGGSGAGAVYQATYAHFLREALALSKLQHPNTLRIYDFGYTGQRPFQISEFLDGGDLQLHVRARGALSAPQALGILGHMAGALAEAHERGIIHRDIKPSNILFGRVGAWLMPKLADFGIANSNLKKASAPDDSSVSTVALFSPRWAAPEQLVVAQEGPFTDVYALALVAAYMLSGLVPFEAPDVRSTFSERVRSEDLVAERLSHIGLDGDLKRVLLGALATEPERRVASPLTFVDELRSVLRVEPTELPVRAGSPRAVGLRAPLPPPPGRPQPDARREPLVGHPKAAGEAVGARPTRVVQVHEKLDLTLGEGTAVDVRFRVSLVPSRDRFQINVKGLNCFVVKSEGDSTGPARPTPAVNAHDDGAVEFVSMNRQPLGRLSWSFGRPTAGGLLFRVSTGDLMVPCSEATQAVALDLGRDRDVVVMCKR